MILLGGTGSLFQRATILKVSYSDHTKGLGLVGLGLGLRLSLKA